MTTRTAKAADPMRIKWRGYPNELQAEGRAEGLRGTVMVSSQVSFGRRGTFRIYYGGRTIEVQSPPVRDAAGDPVMHQTRNGGRRAEYDYLAGYAAAKATAQKLAATWAAEDAAEDAAEKAAYAAQRAAEASAQAEREKRAGRKRAAGEEALALAERLASGVEPATGEAALKLAALVRSALGGEG